MLWKLKNTNELKNINDKIYNIIDLYDKINVINDDIKHIDPKNNKELSKDNNDKLDIIKEKDIKTNYFYIFYYIIINISYIIIIYYIIIYLII